MSAGEWTAFCVALAIYLLGWPMAVHTIAAAALRNARRDGKLLRVHVFWLLVAFWPLLALMMLQPDRRRGVKP